MTTHRKTIVIGAGPGGATAAIYLARFNHEVLLLDAGKEIHGRTAWAFELENVLGFTEPMPGPEFIKHIDVQLRRFGIEKKEEVVSKVSRSDAGRFTVVTNSGSKFSADYLVVSVGVHDVMPDVDNVYDYFGHSIFPCPACNWYQTKDRRTGIVANSDRGLVTARAFNAMQKGSALCVLPDRPDTYFSPDLHKKAEAEGIKVYTSPLICLMGTKGKLESVTLADDTELQLDILYTRLGVKRHDIFLNDPSLPIGRDADGYIQVNFETLESSVPNLFAVGPCNSGQDQVMIAAGQGAVAAMTIHDRLLTELGI
jgi:thioredoxin reductase (NADPH)